MSGMHLLSDTFAGDSRSGGNKLVYIWMIEAFKKERPDIYAANFGIVFATEEEALLAIEEEKALTTDSSVCFRAVRYARADKLASYNIS
jgi:hypothetical protein